MTAPSVRLSRFRVACACDEVASPATLVAVSGAAAELCRLA
jgi:hypothetical protein